MEKKELTKSPRSSMPESGWMDRLFNSPIDEFFNFGKINNMPAVNVSEKENEYCICVAAPGLEKTDFKVEADDNMLTVSAEKEKEEKNGGRYNRREYNYSSWSRSFTLPEGSDASKIDAEYKNGELIIHVPRMAEKETKRTKQISIH